MTRTEFDEWLSDYRKRYPAISNYIVGQGADAETLIDTWHQTLRAFTVETLEGVTRGIIAGRFPPVPNVDLGQFAEQIRQRARSVVEDIRHEKPAERHVLRDPIVAGDMQQMLKCGIATIELLREAGRPTDVAATDYTRPGSVTPYAPYSAAIILADDRTEAEADAAMETIHTAGLTWRQIVDRSESVRCGVFQSVKEVSDDE